MAWSLVGLMSRSSSRLLVMVSPRENSDVPDDAALMRVSYPRRDGAPAGDPCEKKITVRVERVTWPQTPARARARCRPQRWAGRFAAIPRPRHVALARGTRAAGRMPAARAP